jgi:hypothetical protein
MNIYLFITSQFVTGGGVMVIKTMLLELIIKACEKLVSKESNSKPSIHRKSI